MDTFKDYILKETILSSRYTTIYSAIQKSDNAPVILKVVKKEFVDKKFAQKFQNEYSILNKLDNPCIIKAKELIIDPYTITLVLEPFSSRSLSTYIEQEPWDLRARLRIAISIAEAIGDIHLKHIIHKDIKSHNILIDINNNIKIIDFGIATLFAREMPQYIEPEYLEGTLSYISPEQTARMARVVDYRTDIYSLGVTLYELFTGQLPFSAKTPLELVHLHIAERPIPPMNRNNKIPETLSNIILKCLEKDVQDRYKSAFGLMYDLKKCLASLDQTGIIEPFRAGEDDFYDCFHSPDKLFGREKELAILHNCIEKAWEGKLHILELSGYSGIGKSSLAMKFQNEIIQRGGRFSHSRFDQFNKNIPYFAISQIIKILVHDMLMGSEEELAIWKIDLLKALGSNGQIAIELIPDLKLVIGEQPELEKLPPQESENRFKYVMTQLIKALPRPESPIVILFDDFQWCDDASLKLLTHALKDTDIKNLLIIISYRENEVKQLHPLTLAIKEFVESEIEMTHLRIESLKSQSVEAIILDVFSKLPQKELKALSKLVEEKTHGNPFFVIQFLKHLYDKGLIHFEKETLSWTANIAVISTLEISDNVVDLLLEKIKSCNKELIEIMKICSVIGNKFELVALVSLLDEDRSHVLELINDAFQEEFITHEIVKKQEQSKLIFRFSHDRIQQAFYTLIDEKDRTQLHYQVGKSLLETTFPEELDEKLITIVNNLNYGLNLPIDEHKKNELLHLNLRAALKVKQSQAYVSAISYLKIGLQLLDQESWITQYEITFQIYNALAISLQMSGNIEGAKELYELCLSKAKTSDEKVKLYIEMIYLLAQIQEYEKVFEYGELAVKLLNYRVKFKPSKLQTILLIIKTKLRLLFYSNKALENLPISNDPNLWLFGSIGVALGNTAYKTGNRPFLIEITLQLLHLTLTKGFTFASSTAFSVYALILGSEKIGDYAGSTMFGALSLTVTKKLNASAETGVAKFIYANFVHKWKHPLKESIPLLWEAYQECLENGNVPVAVTSLSILSLINILTGENIQKTLEDLNSRIREVHKLTAVSEEKALLIFREFCNALIGHRNDPTDCCPLELKDEIQNSMHNVSKRVYLCYYSLIKGFLLYLFDQIPEATQYAKKNLVLIEYFSGMQLWPLTYLYSALTYAAPMKKAGDNRRHFKEIERLYKQLYKWRKTAPMNFGTHASLVEGEIARLKGKNKLAIQCYNKGIDLAKKENNSLLAAIGYEVLARCHLMNQNSELASFYLESSIEHYSNIGAFAKVKHIYKFYAKYFKEKEKEEKKEEETILTTETQELTTLQATPSTQQSVFNLNEIIQSLQLLSKEINFNNLIKNLMKFTIEKGGATKVALILLEKNNPLLYATMTNQGPFISLESPIPIMEQEENLPVTLIDYVIRMRKEVIINHLHSTVTPFHRDLYIEKLKPESILCLPLIQSFDLKGILYLESDKDPDAFTLNRLYFLSLLSSQIAISIENAQFYSQLEKKVDARTKELQEKNKELQEALTHIKEVQNQLIQQEKLASLGLLTAGIAHELKNPLNFVINFSHIAKDHLNDLKKELLEGTKEEKTYIINDLIYNLNAIDSHGMRANNIIKGMLSHSHQGSNQVEKVDINSIIDQGLNLAYFSYRKKDPAFQMTIETNYAADLPKIEGFSSELMRVFINIVDNACYALSEKSKRPPANFIPKLEISTSLQNEEIQIIFKDNGIGIPEESLNKIFNPFFTSKPTGSGTGLGLSIGYDIITKQHMGTIIARSEPNLMTEIVITLPLPK